MIWTLLCVTADVHVSHITHIAGTDNDSCDQLSRRSPTTSTTLTQHAYNLGLGQTPDLGLSADPDVISLVTLCNPSIPIDTDSEFMSFWKAARSSIDSLVSKSREAVPYTIPSISTLPLSIDAYSPSIETDTSSLPLSTL